MPRRNVSGCRPRALSIWARTTARPAFSFSPARTTDISNAGTIQVIEAFTAIDADGNGIPEGPVAKGTNRYGIRVAPGGTATGSITNSSAITVDGLELGGIAS